MLAASEPHRRPIAGRRWLVPALVIAAAAGLLVVLRAPSTDHPDAAPVAAIRRGTVHAHAGASYTRASELPDEIVRLRSGTIDVDVDPLASGERFRVIVGTDEVEVHGTSFEVVAEADRLIAVSVLHGRVEVRHQGEVAILTAGRSWHVAAAASVETPAPTVAVAPPAPAPVVPKRPRRSVSTGVSPPPASEPPAVEAPRVPDAQDTEFNAGWTAMRRGEFHQAATSFARAITLDPTASIAEDAGFWYAVALARDQRPVQAIEAFRGFLSAFPKSTRAGEASAMLGHLLLDRGERDEARRRFEAAIGDASAAVQRSARDGLAALDRSRP